jgi:hypothetical protein
LFSERDKIEANIQQLQKESIEQLDLERSLHDDIDRMSQTERIAQYQISKTRCEKNKVSRQYNDESGKKRECSQTIISQLLNVSLYFVSFISTFSFIFPFLFLF